MTPEGRRLQGITATWGWAGGGSAGRQRPRNPGGRRSFLAAAPSRKSSERLDSSSASASSARCRSRSAVTPRCTSSFVSPTATVAAREGWHLLNEKPSLLNDALIAASCREQGITLITKDGDFKRLAPFVKGFRYTAPWPPTGGEAQ